MTGRDQIERQKGFIGVVFLVIALIGIVIAAIAAMSRSSGTGADQQMKANVSVVMKQAADVKIGFDQMALQGNVAPSQITFNKAAGTGLFDPALRMAVLNTPPAALIAAGAPAYTYNNNVLLPGIGSNAVADYVMTLGNVTALGCAQINNLLYRDAFTATLATSTGTLAQWTTAPALITDNAGAQAAAANYNGRAEGCIASVDGKYVYYKALAEN